ncbi:putative ribonuclease H-like domain-containing protein [Tanacetum coccineum]
MVHDFTNLPTEVAVSPIPTLRIHNIHSQCQILGDPKSSVQTRSRVQQNSGEHALEEPKKISEALKDDSWVEEQMELIQLEDAYDRVLWSGLKTMFYLPLNEDAIWSLPLQQKMINEEVAGMLLYHNFSREAFIERKVLVYEFEEVMKGRFSNEFYGELIFFLGLQVKQKTDGFFFSQDKYVADMLKKFSLTSVKTAITPMETKMALTKERKLKKVEIYTYTDP